MLGWAVLLKPSLAPPPSPCIRHWHVCVYSREIAYLVMLFGSLPQVLWLYLQELAGATRIRSATNAIPLNTMTAVVSAAFSWYWSAILYFKPMLGWAVLLKPSLAPPPSPCIRHWHVCVYSREIAYLVMLFGSLPQVLWLYLQELAGATRIRSATNAIPLNTMTAVVSAAFRRSGQTAIVYFKLALVGLCCSLL